MTVGQLKGLFYSSIKIDKIKWPDAITLALLNEAQLDFVDGTLCLKATPVTRKTMVDVQTYSISGAKQYLDTAGGYKWTVSPATATEYYCELSGGGDPSLTEPTGVHVGGGKYTEGTGTALEESEYDWGDFDTLGYSTVYIYAEADPDASGAGHVMLDPGGFGISDFVAPIFFRYDDTDITDRHLGIDQIGYGESTQSIQFWSYWDTTIYLDPIPSSSKDIQLWYASSPTVLTSDADTPDIYSGYHPALLYYLQWKWYDGPGQDKAKANDNLAKYRAMIAWGSGREKTRNSAGRHRVRTVFP